MPEYKIKRCAPVVRFVNTESDHDVPIMAERIGKGAFCTAYRDTTQPAVVYLDVNEMDASKEILSTCEGPHFPELERIGCIGDRYLWRTKYYRRLRAGDRAAWAEFKKLAASWQWVQSNGGHQHRPGYAVGAYGYDQACSITDHYEENGGQPSIVAALRQLCDACCNYGSHYALEFAARNLAVDEAGTLILLDPVFNLEEIIRKRTSSARKARGY